MITQETIYKVNPIEDAVHITTEIISNNMIETAPVIVQFNGDLQTQIIENLIGVIDNSNKLFTTSFDYKADSTIVFLNGVKQSKDNYTENNNNQIVFLDAPLNIGMIDNLEIIYNKA